MPAARMRARIFYARRIDAELKSVELLAGAAEDDLKESADLSSVRRFEPRSIFVEENDERDALHALDR